MKRILIMVGMLLALHAPIYAADVLRQSTEVKVHVGPFVDANDAYTPETGITLGAADEAELLKHGSDTVVDISGATWAAITNADGWYVLTLTAGYTDTCGNLTVVINDDSVCLPVYYRATIIEEQLWDSLHSTDKQQVHVVEYTTGVITADAIATDAIGAAELAPSCITASEIATGAIDADAIAASAIGGSELAAGCIGSDELATGCITADAIATDAIGAAEIADGAIDVGALAANCITSSEIADNAIDAGALAADCITSAKIADDALSEEHIDTAFGDEIADQVADEVYEGSTTLRHFIKLFGAVLTGKATRVADGDDWTITFRDIGDTKNRLVVTSDSTGQRTAVGTRDGS